MSVCGKALILQLILLSTCFSMSFIQHMEIFSKIRTIQILKLHKCHDYDGQQILDKHITELNSDVCFLPLFYFNEA